MPGILRCDTIDLNSLQQAQKLVSALRTTVERSRTLPLAVSKCYYFSLAPSSAPDEPGWYVIRDAMGVPLYVGTAQSLQQRLNSENGSRDGFADPKRTTDPSRNFIKRFADLGMLPDLKVTLIRELDLLGSLGTDGRLSKRDRENVEKVIDLFRGLLFPET